MSLPASRYSMSPWPTNLQVPAAHGDFLSDVYFRKKGKATDLVKGAVIETLFSPPQHTLTSAKNLYFWHPIRCGHTRGHREDSLINKTFESAIFVATHLITPPTHSTYLPNE